MTKKKEYMLTYVVIVGYNDDETTNIEGFLRSW